MADEYRYQGTGRNLQKDMLGDWFQRLSQAPARGEPVAYLFISGNIAELLSNFGFHLVYPEVTALQCGIKKTAGNFILKAEELGYSPDVCGYVKNDIGLLHSGNASPMGKLPPPTLLVCNYSGCRTYVKWFEALAEFYKAPLFMLDVPYRRDDEIDPGDLAYVTGQMNELIALCEKLTGKRFDIDRFRADLADTAKAEEYWVRILESARRVPSPFDSYFEAVFFMAPLYTLRGSPDCLRYYEAAWREIEERIAHGIGPAGEERFRVVVEGPAALAALPRLLGDVPALGRGRGGLDLLQGRRAVRPGGAPRSGAAAREHGRVLHELLHQLEPGAAARPDPALPRGLPRRRPGHPLGEELPLVLGRPGRHPRGVLERVWHPDPVHRVRSRRPALFLGRAAAQPHRRLLRGAGAPQAHRCGAGAPAPGARGAPVIAAGVDVGSTATKAILIDENRHILARSCIKTGANVVKAAERVFRETVETAGIEEHDVTQVVGTGYGRYKVTFGHAQVTEISCHARGAAYLFPHTRIILDIGGQDTKAIRIARGGEVEDFCMNDKCAAGTGRFLEAAATTMALPLDEIGPLSLQHRQSIKITNVCTVFVESEILAHLARGRSPADVLRGVHLAIAGRSVALMRRVGLDPEITFTGGVSRNVGICAALEEKLERHLNVSPDSQYMGAIGAALFALDRALTGHSPAAAAAGA